MAWANTNGAVDCFAATDGGVRAEPDSLLCGDVYQLRYNQRLGRGLWSRLLTELESSPFGASYFGTETGVIQYGFADVNGIGAYASVAGADVLWAIQAQGFSCKDASISITRSSDASVTTVPGPASLLEL